MRARTPAWVLAIGVVVGGCGDSPVMPPSPQAPVISCPANMTVRGATGGTAEVLFTPPTTLGGTLPVSVSCTPSSGTRFLTGATPVTCAAMDAQGRQATCTFTVTLAPRLLGATRFIAFGDSVTAGENGRLGRRSDGFVDFPNVYPTILEGLLNAEYPDQGIVVLNRGTGGDPVERSVERLPGVLEMDRGDALLLLDGYNNLLAECTPGSEGTAACSRKIDDVIAGIRQSIRIARVSSYGIRYVFVSTLTPPGPYVGGRRDRRIAAEAIRRTNAALAAMVHAEGATVVDTHARFVGHEAEYVDQDGLHLRPAGYQALAEAFFDAIRERVPAEFRPLTIAPSRSSP
ncbi:MAG: GDSL-type esterase/lipase family protein [Acidobacteriota bacterium]|nr:GDSL-type esterase/lipase family protein [Acidobacteriota bacterium]